MTDPRQIRPYRRGLILGLTMAEIMILLIFLLLMMLATLLSQKEEKIEALEGGLASELVDVMQSVYPDTPPNEWFKELTKAAELSDYASEHFAEKEDPLAELQEYAEMGRQLEEMAARAGAESPMLFAEQAIDSFLEAEKSGWPPFFNLSEAGGYYFDRGKATLKPEFEINLRTKVIPLLHEYTEQYGIEIVEVIGHTDEVPLNGDSNLDYSLISAIHGTTAIRDLSFSDNAGLAIARATAVAKIIREDPLLSNVTILPLSGAQLIEPVDVLASGANNTDDRNRRRIEIRMRRQTNQISTDPTSDEE